MYIFLTHLNKSLAQTTNINFLHHYVISESSSLWPYHGFEVSYPIFEPSENLKKFKNLQEILKKFVTYYVNFSKLHKNTNKVTKNQSGTKNKVKDRPQSSRSKTLLNELMSPKKIRKKEPNDVLNSHLFAKCITYNINKQENYADKKCLSGTLNDFGQKKSHKLSEWGQKHSKVAFTFE